MVRRRRSVGPATAQALTELTEVASRLPAVLGPAIPSLLALVDGDVVPTLAPEDRARAYHLLHRGSVRTPRLAARVLPILRRSLRSDHAGARAAAQAACADFLPLCTRGTYERARGRGREGGRERGREGGRVRGSGAGPDAPYCNAFATPDDMQAILTALFEAQPMAVEPLRRCIELLMNDRWQMAVPAPAAPTTPAPLPSATAPPATGAAAMDTDIDAL